MKIFIKILLIIYLGITNIQANFAEYISQFTDFTQEELQLVDAQYIDYQTQFGTTGTAIMRQLYQKYYNQIAPDYQIDFYEEDQLQISIIRDPCRDITETQCSQRESLGDHNIISAGLDFQIGFLTSGSIVHCSQDWERLINCGTFIEIHRPFDTKIIEQKRVEIFYSEQYEYLYFSTKQLCAGKYELWYVVRSKVGTALQYSQPFYVDYPNCSCDFDVYLECDQ